LPAGRRWNGRRRCRVAATPWWRRPRRRCGTQVHAGKFAAFRIDCDTNDGFSEQWYAPEVKNLVKMRWMGDRDTQTSELWEFHLAK
jgi:hypothetical protein